MVKLSVVVPTLNRPQHVERFLASLDKQTFPAWECIVVDQSDTSQTKEVFDAFQPKSGFRKKYFFQKTKSLILARNNGIRQADADTSFISFFDDDLQLFPDYLAKIMAHFDKDTAKTFAGGMGTLHGFERSTNRFAQFFLMPHDGSGQFLANGCPTFPHGLPAYKEVQFLSGGLSVYRAPVIREYMYDERLVGYGYGDDTDVSYRISRKHKLFFEPLARTLFDNNVGGKDPGKLFRSRWVQNMFYLLQKNVGSSFTAKAAFWWMVLGLAIDDVLNFRRSALLGTSLGVFKILAGRIDSVLGYQEFINGKSKGT